MEEWIEEGEKIDGQQHKGVQRGLSDADRTALWQWAPGAANREARKQKWGADYTLEEIRRGVQKVTTGLRRELVEPQDDEGEEDDDEEEDEEEYEASDDEDADKMDMEQTKTQGKPGGSLADTTLQVAADQMPLDSIHKYMTTGR